MSLESIKQEWFGNIRGDFLAGIVVALALIPEAIAFSIIAGVDPMVGLYASFAIAIVIAFVGGRPAMISAATGAMALVMVNLVKDHGLQYLLAATLLTGIIQIIFGLLKLARYMNFIPRSVMVGFVNSLAILIFMAQLPNFIGESWVMYAMVAGSLAIIYLFPLVTKAIPSPLIAIIVITTISLVIGADVRTVGDMGKLTQTLPTFAFPNIPLNFETLAIIFPYSIALAVVGLLESLLTAAIVDDMTDSESNKNTECRGQGIANIIAGLFGGMAGCAMIGQSVINVKSGGRGRLSTLIAGLFLIFLIMILGDLVVRIPMAVLTGIMFMVSVGTFDWSSIKTLKIVPKTDSAVMLVTVVTVVLTHNLAIGVLAGVILSAIFFTDKLSRVQITSKVDNLNRKVYFVNGQIFFASVTSFLNAFNYRDEQNQIVIDLTHTHLWDDSAIAAIDKVIAKYAENNTDVELIGLNKHSTKLLNKLTGKLNNH